MKTKTSKDLNVRAVLIIKNLFDEYIKIGTKYTKGLKLDKLDPIFAESCIYVYHNETLLHYLNSLQFTMNASGCDPESFFDEQIEFIKSKKNILLKEALN